MQAAAPSTSPAVVAPLAVGWVCQEPRGAVARGCARA